MAQWFLVRDGNEQGPFDDVQLRKLAADGILNPSDIVRREGSATGSPAKKVKGLFTLPTSAEKKRPPAPPARLGVSPVTESAIAASVVSRPMPAAPSQNGTPMPVPTPAIQKESRLNPNITFILGIWVGIGLCAAAFTGLAITGRFAPLVAWLETTAQKETKQQEQAKPESPPATAAEVSKPDADGGTKEADDSPSEPGTLTAEFYPYHDGVSQQWDIQAFLPNGAEWLQSANHSYIGNGIIRSVTTQRLGKVDGKTIDMLAIAPKAKEPRDEHYRQKAGFIETADDEKDPDKMIWKPLVKLGAKPGDEWEDAHGFEKFKLLRFENKRLNIKGFVTTDDVLVAVIEESMTGSVAEHEFAFGIGPVSLKAWLLNDGKKTLSASHALVAMSNKNDTGGSSVAETPTGKSSLPPSARKIFAKTGTATSTNPSSIVHKLNRQIEDLEVHAINEDLIIEFGVDVSGQWPLLPSKLLVRLFDQNGKYLTHFETEEAFTPRTDVYQPLKQRWDQVQAAGARGNHIKPFLLLHRGNRIVYGVNARDLRDTDAVEIGFMAP